MVTFLQVVAVVAGLVGAIVVAVYLATGWK